MKPYLIVTAFIFLALISCSKENNLKLNKKKPVVELDLESRRGQTDRNSSVQRKRSIDDFLDAQGTVSTFLPPVPDFYGWVHVFENGTVRLVAFDYLGVVDDIIRNVGGPDLGTEIDGSVTEIPLEDGRALVKVNIQIRNGLFWITDFDGASEHPAFSPLIMGARPADVIAGKDAALADAHFRFVFKNSAPGAPFPDLVRATFDPSYDAPGYEDFQTRASMSGFGELHKSVLMEGDWEEGDYGHAHFSFSGLFHNLANENSKLFRDGGFVGTAISVRAIGSQ